MNYATIDPALEGHETELHVRSGETLFREGEPPRGVFVLLSGAVNLFFAAKNGETRPLRAAQPGQMLGLSAVVTRRPHDCMAVAASPCRIAFIEQGDFLRALDDSPSVWFSVLHLLSSDVNAVYDDMRALAAR